MPIDWRCSGERRIGAREKPAVSGGAPSAFSSPLAEASESSIHSAAGSAARGILLLAMDFSFSIDLGADGSLEVGERLLEFLLRHHVLEMDRLDGSDAVDQG